MGDGQVWRWKLVSNYTFHWLIKLFIYKFLKQTPPKNKNRHWSYRWWRECKRRWRSGRTRRAHRSALWWSWSTEAAGATRCDTPGGCRRRRRPRSARRRTRSACPAANRTVASCWRWWAARPECSLRAGVCRSPAYPPRPARTWRILSSRSGSLCAGEVEFED